MGGRFSRLELDGSSAEAAGGEAEHAARRTAAPAVAAATTPAQRASLLLAQAEGEQRQGRYEPALRLYTRCLQEERAMIPAWVGQVRMLIELGELHEARLWCDKALELFCAHGELLAARAQACIRLGERAAALAAIEASLQAKGSSSWCWTVRGEVLLARGEQTGEHCFRKALAEPQADWHDRVVIARIHLYHDQAVLGLRYAQEALQLAPTQPQAWLVQADCQREIGLSRPARQSYLHALQLLPRLEEARLGLRLLEEQGWWARLRRRLRGWGG